MFMNVVRKQYVSPLSRTPHRSKHREAPKVCVFADAKNTLLGIRYLKQIKNKENHR